MPYIDLIGDGSAEAVGIALLKASYSDKDAFQELLKKLELDVVSRESYEAMVSENITLQNELAHERGEITDEDQNTDTPETDTPETDSPSTNLTVPDLKAALDEMGVEYKSGDKKPELVKLYDEALKGLE